MAVWGLIWWQQVERDLFRPEATSEPFLFILSPIALLVLADVADLRLFDRHFEVAPLILAAAYLPVGWFRRSSSHLIMGFMLAALAMAFPWQSATIVIGWTALALLALAV